VRILHDVVEALAYAHGRGVVHRDIKPGNILTIGSHALVTDFGVAKALSVSMPVSGMTSAGMAIGTPAYMAPEQLAADPAADHRIDIYAVGLLAYELLSGQSPFVGTSPAATMAAQLTRVPDPLDKVRDDVPPMLASVIMRCLEKLPENRPQTANALLDELDGLSTPAGGVGSSGATTAIPVQKKSRGQRSAVTAGALLVIIAGVAVAVTMMRKPAPGGARSMSVSGAPPSTPTPPAAAIPATGATIGPTRTLADSAVRTPIVLSRVESLAIADAIRKRVTARRDSQVAKGEQQIADSLTRRFERALSDSLMRIIGALRNGRQVPMQAFDPKDIERFRELAKMSGSAMPNVPTTVYRLAPGPGEGAPAYPPPAPGIRRVLVGATRNSMLRREMPGIAVAISDSLSKAIAARPGYDVVDAAKLTDPRLNRSRNALARTVGAGAVLTGLYFPRQDSTVVLQLQLFDVQRNRVLRVVESKPIDASDPMRGIGDLIASTLSALDDVDWRPFQPDSTKRP
jgi:serine/threonine-protein kinase